ncbi:DegT/DnrJ/EryC1/StrS aminotransferase family protein [Henriciella sp.]|uniref:DegT/DnrJ/EryC1/StrS family aminotransferase n=1 Tax=Henriciella sp. TaxID=1968823 RepID=UPI0026182D4D|nr:DegT/DnrJ/EryC1/StrS aminotransferase family protein [Henriciella sp.]
MQFIDLQAQRARISDRIDSAIAKVLESGQFVMGPQVKQFEEELAAFSKARHAVGCANGTDAIALPLMAWELQPGDAVFCPSFTFCATAEVIPWLGATPVFVDVQPDTFNMDPGHLEAAIEQTLKEGKLTPKVIIGVCLFGQAANYPRLREVADKYGLKLIADSAQGFGTTISGRHPSDYADIVTTSFFPAKPLGCYGDGGAVVTNDAALAERIDSLRVHGKAVASDTKGADFEHDPKYLNMRIGMNSRLDSIQAAILSEKLAIFADEIEMRNRVAARYNEKLAPHVMSVPAVAEGVVSTWAQYTIEHEDRDGLQAHLRSKGIPSAVYYPVPMHMNVAYEHYPTGPGGLPVTEALAGRVMSLPMHPYLGEDDQDRIVEAVAGFSS